MKQAARWYFCPARIVCSMNCDYFAPLQTSCKLTWAALLYTTIMLAIWLSYKVKMIYAFSNRV